MTQQDSREPLARPKLELQWIGKSRRPLLEPRLLIPDRQNDWPPTQAEESTAGTGNRLIHGDNLLALKSLERDFAGKVKCVFIDPPYNTGAAFAQYDDGLEHSVWLGLMRDRLELIARLLSPEGSLWISIDDNEAHYLKVVCDEIFGRRNFVANVVWQKRTSPDARLRLGGAHDHILVFAKDAARLEFNRLGLSAEQAEAFTNRDDDPRGPWASTDFTAQGWRPNQMYPIASPDGTVFEPPTNRCWANVEPVFQALRGDNRIWFGPEGRSRPRVKTFLSERKGMAPWSWWENNEVGHNAEAKKESIDLFGAACAFATPKPERLIKRVLEIATEPGDLVLDSFAGSGTTGAVAHKMGRRWIMVELGDHCHTHIAPRMRRVVDGTDPGGVTAAAGWKGGGSFRSFRLAPSLIERDEWGEQVIARSFDPAMLAEAVCRLTGFTYAPSDSVYWQHGYSSETDFIFVTAQTMTASALAALSAEVGPGRSLLVYCSAFTGTRSRFANLTVVKTLKELRDSCTWGRDDYSLPVPAQPDLPSHE